MTKSVVLSLGLVGLLSTPLWAQDLPPATPDAPRVAERRMRRQAVPRVALTISAQAGAKILVTSPLLEQLVTVPETVATDANLEAVLTDLIHRLPDATWAKIYLPILSDGKHYRADAVALLIKAQADVYRLPDKSPDKTPPKTVLIQGQWLTEEEAQPLIKTLHLEPVYVLLSRSATTASLAGQGGTFNALNAVIYSIGVSDSNAQTYQFVPSTILIPETNPEP